MANKYHRQGFKGGKIVDLLSNIYKLDKTGKKDEIIESMNKRLKKERVNRKIEQEPDELERYTDLTVSDFNKKTGPFFDRLEPEKKLDEKQPNLKN